MDQHLTPPKQGLYDPWFEHDACGVGFVADLKGRKSRGLIDQALQILVNLEHRGACGCETNTGDGAGILIQLPHRFIEEAAGRAGFKLPAPGAFGVGQVFLPTDPGERKKCVELFEQAVRDEGQTVLGWRDVPTDNSMIGPTAKRVEPAMKQIFIGQAHGQRPVGAGAHRPPPVGVDAMFQDFTGLWGDGRWPPHPVAGDASAFRQTGKEGMLWSWENGAGAILP